ncbi:MAG TPA: non-ribosomal peptide synthetase, partial [Gammaproteobacteria bacterium]|nr:non-ribosomal peptide synthetase [Gammaproteobacteria bacterium]
MNLLLPEEQQQLNNWNTTTNFEQDFCLHQRFEAQVSRDTDAIALVDGDRHYTYGELSHLSDCLARVLISNGLNSGDFVGLMVPRSADIIIGILGILKAGGVYVPLDVASPAERLLFIAQDADLRVLLTTSALAKQHHHYPGAILNLDELDYLNDGTTIELPQVRPSSNAYMIYTSGTTGKPKGVMVRHENVARLFTATDDLFQFSDKDVWTLFHSYAFDFSVWEIWGALLYGGRLVIVDYETSRSPHEFLRLLHAESVTVLNQTPSAFYQLIEEDQLHSFELDLRTVIFGGEALNFAALRSWVDKHGLDKPQLVNMYGI